MANLLGFLSISIVASIVLILAKRAPSISLILIIAFLFRLILLFIEHFLGPLPESMLDAKTFERIGWEWSQADFYTVLFRFPSEVQNGWILSGIISILYSLTDRSIIMVQSISLIFGMSSIYLGWRLANEMWSEKIATRCAWLIAFFPSWCLYSVLILREVYIYFFILYALIGIVRWTKYEKLIDLLKAIGGLLLASLFHGAIAVGLLAFIFLIFLRSFRSIFTQHISKKYFIRNFLILLIAGVVVFMFFKSSITIPYIGSFENIGVERILQQHLNTSFGETAFPDWLLPSGFIDILIKAPIRVCYFLFSPFIWNISHPIHLFGVIDGFIYLILFLLILRGHKLFSKNRSALILIYLLVIYILIYSYGSGNSGTAIRHRAKLFPIIIVLAAPMIPIIRFHRPIYDRKQDNK